MALFSRFSKKNPESPAYKWRMAERIADKRIRYVGEKIDGVEEIIGKGGSVSIREDELFIFSSSDVLLRAKIAKTQIAELLSRDGAVITAPDLERDGQVRTVVIYYVYYR